MFIVAVVLSILSEILGLCYLPQIYQIRQWKNSVGWKRFLKEKLPESIDYPVGVLGFLGIVYLILSVCLLFSHNILHVYIGTAIIAISFLHAAFKMKSKKVYYPATIIDSVVCTGLLILLLIR
jgi:hypothetical protein